MQINAWDWSFKTELPVYSLVKMQVCFISFITVRKKKKGKKEKKEKKTPAFDPVELYPSNYKNSQFFVFLYCSKNSPWLLSFPLFLATGRAATLGAASFGRRAVGGYVAGFKEAWLDRILQPLEEFLLCHVLVHVGCRNSSASVHWGCSLCITVFGSDAGVDMEGWFVSVGRTSHSLQKPLHGKSR